MENPTVENQPEHSSGSQPTGFVGPWKKLAYLLGVICTLYYLRVAVVGVQYPEIDRSLFIFFGIGIGLALKPINGSKILRCIDVLLLIGAGVATVRFNSMYNEFLEMIGLPISDLDMIFGWFMILLSLEVCRRALGAAVPILALIFLAMLRYGPAMPEPFKHAEFSYRTIASYMYAGTDGLYSDITYVLASQMFLFLIFGAFLLRSGASDWFSDISMILVGHRAGGTAKASVASSAIIGSITGSAAANAAVTGAVTIPLMRRNGFEPHVAAGIEAAASTGGTVLPPVMGVAAFIMVALTGISYATIAIYSAIPALLYFLFIYFQVDFYAKRHGLTGAARAKRGMAWIAFKQGWQYLLPVGIVVVLIVIDYSLAYIAFLAIVSTIAVSWMRKETRMGLKTMISAMAEGAQSALPIMVIAGPVAILSQSLLLPGTGLQITGMILDVGAGSLLITLLIVFAVAFILGMGLSVVPAYIILATLAAPAVIQLGVDVLPAHLLVMWWSQAANITPPVALAVYVTASLAGSKLWPTCWQAVLKGAGLFFIPALFVYRPALLLEGSAWDIGMTFVTIVVGIGALAAAIEGYLKHPLPLVPRVIVGIASVLLLFMVNPLAWLAGVVLLCIGVFLSRKAAVANAGDVLSG